MDRTSPCVPPQCSESVRKSNLHYTYITHVMYTYVMKRLQIMIDEELDEALEREALRTKTSKAALIREYVRERLDSLPPLDADPLWRMAGNDNFEPESIDDVVYR